MRQLLRAAVLSGILTIGQGNSPAATAAEVHLTRTNLLQYLDDAGRVRPVKSLADWEQRRNLIRLAMQKVMGSLPGPERRCPLAVEVLEEIDCGSYIQRCITYESEPGSAVPAYLLIPKSVLVNEGSTAPGILCLHQTHRRGYDVVVGLGDSPNDEYGVELARRGYVCLAPAYPLLGNYLPDLQALGYVSGTMKAIWDNIRGLDFLESLPYVRKGCFGAIGHSLGGHNAIYTAAFDERLNVIISSCGFDSFRDYMGGDIRGWTSLRYMPKLADYGSSAVPFDFYEVIASLAPRFCFVSAPIGDSNFRWWSVDRIFNAATQVFDLYEAGAHLRLWHPDCGHLFPKAMREQAYEFLDQQMRREENRAP